MLPPQTTTTRAWPTRLAGAVAAARGVVAETQADAARAVGHADAAFGTLPDALLATPAKLRGCRAAGGPPAATTRRR